MLNVTEESDANNCNTLTKRDREINKHSYEPTRPNIQSQ